MSLLLWIIVFVVSVTILIKAANVFTENSEKLGIALGVPAFIVGLTIVSIGTSLPELATAFIAVFKGASEVVAANAIGSNIANILLIIGVAAVLARVLEVKRDLINLDLPLLVGSAIILFFVAQDGMITFPESIILIIGYIIYIFYTLYFKEKVTEDALNKKEFVKGVVGKNKNKKKTEWKTVALIVVSAFFIYLGAEYTIESLVKMAGILGIGSSVIAMSALAVGTSLPELVVSVGAVLKGKHEIGIGNIVGSNIFNTFVVIGFPGLFSRLTIDQNTLYLGIPFFIAATLLFVFSGISRKIYSWEGMIYLLIFVLFVSKLFNLF